MRDLQAPQSSRQTRNNSYRFPHRSECPVSACPLHCLSVITCNWSNPQDYYIAAYCTGEYSGCTAFPPLPFLSQLNHTSGKLTPARLIHSQHAVNIDCCVCIPYRYSSLWMYCCKLSVKVIQNFNWKDILKHTAVFSMRTLNRTYHNTSNTLVCNI